MLDRRLLLEVAGACILVVGGLWVGSAHSEAKHKAAALAAEQKAAVAQGQAAVTKGAAEQSDRQVAGPDMAATKRADALAASAKRGLAVLKATSPKLPLPSDKPGAEGGAIPATLSEGVTQLQAIVDKQAEVIEAQDAQIKARDQVILDLTTSRDQWKATAHHLQDQADAQALAAAEWRKAVGAGERRAGIKWGVIGMGVGFLVGRR